METRPPTLGEYIAQRRKELGISSQSALAELAGLDTSVINRLEKNRDPDYNPQVETLARLARVLQVDLDTLARYTSARDQVPAGPHAPPEDDPRRYARWRAEVSADPHLSPGAKQAILALLRDGEEASLPVDHSGRSG